MSTSPRPTTCLLAGCLSLAALVATADEANDKLFARLDANADHLLDASEVDAEHGRLFDRLIRRADRDNDGRLSPAEFAAGLTPSAPPKPIVDEPADSNPGADALRLMLLKLDANRDGMLTKAEAPDHLADAFDQLASVVDQDGNNRIIYRELVQASRPATQAAVRVARRERWDVASELKRITAEQGDDAKRFDAPPNPRAALGSRARMEDLFTQLDANADGRLRLDELPEQYRGRLGRLVRVADRDSSGDVSLEEFLTQSQRAARILAMAEQRQGAPSDDAPRDDLAGGMMAEDSSTEDSMADDLMRGADARSSRRPRQQAQGQAENGRSLRRALAALDRNGDGMIQAAEASGPLKRRFDRLDANADGQLDPRELRRAAQQRQRQASPADRPRNQSEKP